MQTSECGSEIRQRVLSLCTNLHMRNLAMCFERVDCDLFDLHQRCGAKSLFYFQHQRVSGEGVAMMKWSSALGIITATALCCAAPLSLHWSPANAPSVSVDTADARVGRPLTPMSVAGVNRRVHRRAYYGAAAAAAGAAGYGYYNYYGRQCGYAPYPPCY